MKILVPTDFSDNAKNAFEFAKKIAKTSHGTITLLYAYYNIYDFAAQSSSIFVQIEEIANQAMEELSADQDGECMVDQKIVQGSIATAVTSTAYRENYDLIIMGTQGASGINKALIGSNTAHVIRDSRVPVLAVPFQATYDKIKEIVVSVEWDTTEKKFFEKLFQISQQWEWPFRTLHIKTEENDKSEHTITGLMQFLEKNYPNIQHSTAMAEDIYEGINHHLQEESDCLLVMFSKQRPFFEHLLSRGNIEKMAYHTHTPLLVLK